MQAHPSRRVRRLAGAALLAGALVAGALVALPGDASLQPGSLAEAYERSRPAGAVSTGPDTATGTEAKPHRHDDPTTKNALSRSGEVGSDTQDPTTAAERRRNAAYVERERALPDPDLERVRVRPQRTEVPQNRYAMAGGCYALSVGRSRPVTKLFFQAVELGTYLLYTADRSFVGPAGTPVGDPGPDTEWTVREPSDRRFTFTQGDGVRLGVGDRGLTTSATGALFRLRSTGGCPRYPEAQVDVSGKPHAGVTAYQEVRGYADAHTHHMAFEFLGGEAHCGKPWDRYGVEFALVDCEDHQTGTNPMEAFLSEKPTHDPEGWPTFKDWPAPESLTHEGTYYRWVERAWRGGQRLFVNLLVENNVLCTIYPFKRNSCDDMDSVRLQAKRMYQFQDYVDAQFGGPGKGFYRIVKSPFEARGVINAGKMAVVMGMETSLPFGCTMKLDIPQCTSADITRQLDEMHALGVRQMELLNKFDNALSGVAGDSGAVGVAINNANFAETGSYWDMRHCEPADGESTDRPQLAAPEISADQQDALFGAIGELFGTLGTALPVYPPPAHCNRRGLTTLGEHTIRELAKRHMLFDPDHMSVKARRAAMDQIEDLDYPGVLSSHSWSTPDTYPRIYRAGGFIAPYAGDSTGFVEKWRRHVGWADERYYYGIGFGADMNGLGAQGNPRGADVANPVRYPFRGLNGVRVAKQRAGERVYDINVDGVAQYGLYPDWVEDLRKVAGATDPGDGADIVDDMARGAEAYLQTWERAYGIAPDPCRNPGLRKKAASFGRLVRRGMSTRAVLEAVGQPFLRLGTTYRYCVRTPRKATDMVVIRFNEAGQVVRVRTT